MHVCLKYVFSKDSSILQIKKKKKKEITGEEILYQIMGNYSSSPALVTPVIVFSHIALQLAQYGATVSSSDLS